jgi:hypothetical protein
MATETIDPDASRRTTSRRLVWFIVLAVIVVLAGTVCLLAFGASRPSPSTPPPIPSRPAELLATPPDLPPTPTALPPGGLASVSPSH